MNETINLTGGRLLARNTLFNLIGQAAPMLVAVFTIPALIKGLGTDRFGVLTIAWMAVGYFSLFDFGLSRAITVLVSEKLGAGKEKQVCGIVWTALFLIMVLGLSGMFVLYNISPWVVYDLLKIPQHLRSEVLHSFRYLAFSIPIVILTVGLGGILAAYQQFGFLNLIRIPMGVYTFVGPLLVLPFSRSIVPVVIVLVVGRLIALLAHLITCMYVAPTIRQGIVFDLSVIKPLLGFGSWLTVTNVIGPMMVYLDRFLIGMLLSMTAVAYYTTPYEVITKLWLIPVAITGVLIPAFATSFVKDVDRTILLFNRGIKYVYLSLYPITLLFVIMAKPGLYYWLGIKFAQNSSYVLQWLAIGVFINGLAQMPFALIQGIGRPDITSKLHIVELPFYLILLWWLTKTYGIYGTALAWVVRVVIDGTVLFILTRKLLSNSVIIDKKIVLITAVSLLTFVFAFLPLNFLIKVIFLLIIFTIFIFVTWSNLLVPEEQTMLAKLFRKQLYNNGVKYE